MHKDLLPSRLQVAFAITALIIICLSGLAAAGEARVSGSHANEILIGRIYQ
jgi:hypothetical protein